MNGQFSKTSLLKHDLNMFKLWCERGISLLTYSLSVYASYVSLTESEFVPPLPLSLMSGEPAAVDIAGKQSSLLGQSKIFSAS